MSRLITGIERVAVDRLECHPANPRRGDVAAIAESLQRNGQFAPIVVQTSTRYALAGNHTLLAARQLGWPEIDVVFVDVDDQAAYRIMLAANRTAERGTYDQDALVELLSYLDGDLAGSGYSNFDVQALIGAPPWDDEHAIDALPAPDLGEESQDGDSPMVVDGQVTAREYDPSTASGDYMQLSWLVPVDGCDTVRAALGAARKSYELATLGEALVAMARDWLAANRN